MLRSAISHRSPFEVDWNLTHATVPPIISSSVATNSNGLSPLSVEVAIGGVAVAGVENENVGSALMDGSAVTNETVGRKEMVGSGAAVVVGAMVEVAGT